MMRSSILGASTMLNVLIQHLPLQSLFWTKIWRAFRASDPSTFNRDSIHLAMVFGYACISNNFIGNRTTVLPIRLHEENCYHHQLLFFRHSAEWTLRMQNWVNPVNHSLQHASTGAASGPIKQQRLFVNNITAEFTRGLRGNSRLVVTMEARIKLWNP